MLANHGVETIRRRLDDFEVVLHDGRSMVCDRLLLALGGCRTERAGQLAVSLGHTLEPPVPSLFSFCMPAAWLRECAGIAIASAEVSLPEMGLYERGPVLITHEGLSGPAILRLSAWGARAMHALNYQAQVRVNWMAGEREQGLAARLESLRHLQSKRLVVNAPLEPIAARLWERLVIAAGVARETRWAQMSRGAQHRLVKQLMTTQLQMTGKSLNKEEFVTCGGVRLNEVNFRTMESRVCRGLYFAGEILDIDAVTGGFNFQAAWTTGWIAGQAMAQGS
jgi:hypothetical protein